MTEIRKLDLAVNDTVLVTERCVTRFNLFRRTMSQNFYKYLMCPNRKYRRTLWSIYQAILLLILLIYPCSAHTWESPGCHRVGKRLFY